MYENFPIYGNYFLDVKTVDWFTYIISLHVVAIVCSYMLGITRLKPQRYCKDRILLTQIFLLLDKNFTIYTHINSDLIHMEFVFYYSYEQTSAVIL